MSVNLHLSPSTKEFFSFQHWMVFNCWKQLFIFKNLTEKTRRRRRTLLLNAKPARMSVKISVLSSVPGCPALWHQSRELFRLWQKKPLGSSSQSGIFSVTQHWFILIFMFESDSVPCDYVCIIILTHIGVFCDECGPAWRFTLKAHQSGLGRGWLLVALNSRFDLAWFLFNCRPCYEMQGIESSLLSGSFLIKFSAPFFPGQSGSRRKGRAFD